MVDQNHPKIRQETLDLIHRIVTENSQSPSWRQKLEIAANIANVYKN